jgi:hypothetical protein
MNKNEALDLALEALEELAARTGARWALEQNYAGHLEAITAIKQALAAPVQEPVCPACESIEWEGQPCQICQPTPAQPAPVQEPVGYVAENGVVDWNVCAPPILTDLYTTPPAQPEKGNTP